MSFGIPETPTDRGSTTQARRPAAAGPPPTIRLHSLPRHIGQQRTPTCFATPSPLPPTRPHEHSSQVFARCTSHIPADVRQLEPSLHPHMPDAHPVHAFTPGSSRDGVAARRSASALRRCRRAGQSANARTTSPRGPQMPMHMATPVPNPARVAIRTRVNSPNATEAHHTTISANSSQFTRLLLSLNLPRSAPTSTRLHSARASPCGPMPCVASRELGCVHTSPSWHRRVVVCRPCRCARGAR